MAVGHTTSSETLKVLYAEDGTTYHVTIPFMIQRLGYSCELVTSGPAAVEKFSEDKFPYHKVIMDRQMPPTYDGIEAIRRILEMMSNGSKYAHRFALFNADDFNQVAMAVDELKIHYLKKPGSISEFKEFLDRV